MGQIFLAPKIGTPQISHVFSRRIRTGTMTLMYRCLSPQQIFLAPKMGTPQISPEGGKVRQPKGKLRQGKLKLRQGKLKLRQGKLKLRQRKLKLRQRKLRQNHVGNKTDWIPYHPKGCNLKHLVQRYPGKVKKK